EGGGGEGGGGVGRGGRGGGLMARAEDGKNEGGRVAEARIEGLEPLLDLWPDRLGAVAVGKRETAPQEPPHHEPRDAPAVRWTVDLVDSDPPDAATSGELSTQPALADPRVAHDADDLPVAVDRAREEPVEPRQLGLSSDHAREAPAA